MFCFKFSPPHPHFPFPDHTMSTAIPTEFPWENKQRKYPFPIQTYNDDNEKFRVHSSQTVVLFILKKLEHVQNTRYKIRQQVAQLSQRDRASGCVSFGQKWKAGTERLIFYRHYRSTFNHYDIISLQSNRIRWEKRKIRDITPLKVIQGHRRRYQSKARMRLFISD